MMVFISGVAGFLGSHLADALLAGGHRVVGNDSLVGGELANVPAGVEFFEADCNDLSAIRARMEGVDLVYHCAASAHEGLSVFSPHIITQDGVAATAGVLSAAIAARVKKFVFCSSMARYGVGVGSEPFRETLTPAPVDPYGIGKWASERLVECLCDAHDVAWAVAVPHNIIGPRQKYDDPYRNVASIFINMALQGRAPTIYGDGLQTRCFTFVDDAVQPLVRMGLDGRVNQTVINIGPDRETVTIRELWEQIQDILRIELDPVYAPARPLEVRAATCNARRARSILGYEPRVSLREGLESIVAWVRAKGPKPFVYHLPIEIVSELTPATWKEQKL